MTDVGPETISGAGYLAVLGALRVLDRHRLPVPNYTFTAVRGVDDPAVLVSAADRPAFGVRLDAAAELAAGELVGLAARLAAGVLGETVTGTSLRAIIAAEAEFRRKFPALDLTGYNITVVRGAAAVVVLFTAADLDPGARGGGRPGRPGFEVELDPRDLTVRRANFPR